MLMMISNKQVTCNNNYNITLITIRIYIRYLLIKKKLVEATDHILCIYKYIIGILSIIVKVFCKKKSFEYLILLWCLSQRKIFFNRILLGKVVSLILYLVK